MNKKKYDVIIVGAGIGGLTCGCYLAKSGKKVLIIEQHDKVGGYLTSFRRKNFIFEAGAIEDLGDKCTFRKIINDLGIDKKVDFLKSDPHIIIITPEHKINIRFNFNDTVEGLGKLFPHQATAIESFFHFVNTSSIITLYQKCKSKTFDMLLNDCFKDKKLKAIFRIFASQIGAPSSMVPALAGIAYFKAFIMNGGYYPAGGLQTFSNSFEERFKEFGGELMLSRPVDKIVIDSGVAKGVMVGEEYIPSKYVVSSADATTTFMDLIGESHFENDFISSTKRLVPSTSAFIVYLGIKGVFRNKWGHVHELWDIPTYDIDDPFEKNRLENNFSKTYLYCWLTSFMDTSLAPRDSESISLGIFVPYLSREYWQRNRKIFEDQLIERAAKVFPDIKGNIVVQETAIPQTLNRYTSNRDGAFKGWAPLMSQVDIPVMKFKIDVIRNLYLSGHWVSTLLGESGVPQAAYIGQRVANSIIKQKK